MHCRREICTCLSREKDHRHGEEAEESAEGRGREASTLTAGPGAFLSAHFFCLENLKFGLPTISSTHIIRPNGLASFQKLLKTEHLLWQLYTIEKDMEKIEAELEEERGSLQQAREENQSSENELAAKKKEQSAFLKKITLCEKNMAKKKLDIDKKVSTLLALLNSTKSSIMELLFVAV